MKKATIKRSILTSKGQLTVPKEVRDLLELKPGDGLVFEIEGEDTVRLRVQRRGALAELKGSLSAERAYPGKEAEREAAREYVFGKSFGETAP